MKQEYDELEYEEMIAYEKFMQNECERKLKKGNDEINEFELKILSDDNGNHD